MLSKFLNEEKNDTALFQIVNPLQYSDDISTGFLSFNGKISPSYIQEMKKLELKIKGIDIYALSVVERLKTCLELLFFFQLYWLEPGKILKPGMKLAPSEIIHWESRRLIQIRQIFRFTCEVFLTLPENFIRNYEALLLPQKKFTRKTFEYFGALMKFRPITRNHFVFFEYQTYTEETHGYFKNEFNEQEKILEAALESTIIKNEVIQFIQFFKFLLKNQNELLKEHTEAEVRKKFQTTFEFPGIYAVTKRIIDTYCLRELSLLTLPQNSPFTSNSYIPDALNRSYKSKDTRAFFQREHNKKILTQIEKYSLLRKLQRIGELVTGKHLQSRITCLEETVDWNLFITIRDTISHQNQWGSDNYHKINEFLKNDELIARVTSEIIVMNAYILNLIGLRYKISNAHISDRNQSESEYKIFWEKVLQEQITADNVPSMKSEKEKKKAYYKPNEEEIKLLKSGLKKDLSEAQKTKVDAILNGNEILSNNRKRSDFLNEMFESRQENTVQRQERQKCAKLLKKMMKEIKVKRTKEDFEKEKQKEHEERLERDKLLKQKSESTFLSIRELVNDLKKPTNFGLDNKNCLQAAVHFIDDIASLLNDIDGKLASETHKNNFYKKLNEDECYKNAFEYCVSQALSMICESKEKIDSLNNCDYFKTYGKEFRDLRNWIVHNNAILDFFEEPFDGSLKTVELNDLLSINGQKILPLIDFRHIVIYPIITHILVYLLPSLNETLSHLPDNTSLNSAPVIYNSSQMELPKITKYYLTLLIEAMLHDNHLLKPNTVSKQNIFTTTMQALQHHAENYGYGCQNVVGDGNCVFYATADQLNRILGLGLDPAQIKHLARQLRILAINHIIQHRNFYEGFISETELKHQSQDKAWADDTLITALCYALNVNLICVRSDGAEPTIKRLPQGICTLILGYEIDLHYQSLYAIDTQEAKEKQASLEIQFNNSGYHSLQAPTTIQNLNTLRTTLQNLLSNQAQAQINNELYDELIQHTSSLGEKEAIQAAIRASLETIMAENKNLGENSSTVLATEKLKRKIKTFFEDKELTPAFKIFRTSAQELCIKYMGGTQSVGYLENKLRELINALRQELTKLNLIEGLNFNVVINLEGNQPQLKITSQDTNTTNSIGSILEEAGQNYWNQYQLSNSKVFFFKPTIEVTQSVSGTKLLEEQCQISCGIQ